MPLQNDLVKTANKKQKFTLEHARELQRCMDDPLYFLENFYYIQHPTQGKLKYVPYEFQKDLINSYHNHRFSVNLLGRQLGKTTTAAGYLLWYAMFIPDSTILIAAHKFTGTQEIMARVRYGYECCPDHIRAGVLTYNKHSIEFENKSRIIAQTTTETTGRGLSISLLYCDELSFVAPHKATEFWTSISPTLATGGKAIITSTPNSDEDTFALIWKEANERYDEFGNTTGVGKNGFHPFMATWDQHPDRDDEWARSERSRIGSERFEREHNCIFLTFDETLISGFTLNSLSGIEPKVHSGHVRWYKDIDPAFTYLVSLDPSLGTGGDYAGIEVLELPSFTQVAEWHHNTTPIQRQVKILRDICRHIEGECKERGATPSIYYSIENNTLGEAALISVEEIGEETIPGLFLSEPLKRGHVRIFRRGFNTTHKSKIAACSKLKQLIESNVLQVKSKILISQLKSYIARENSFAAKDGCYDDLVASLLLNIRMVMVLQEWDRSIYDRMHEHVAEETILPMPIYIG